MIFRLIRSLFRSMMLRLSLINRNLSQALKELILLTLKRKPPLNLLSLMISLKFSVRQISVRSPMLSLSIWRAILSRLILISLISLTLSAPVMMKKSSLESPVRAEASLSLPVKKMKKMIPLIFSLSCLSEQDRNTKGNALSF